MAHTHRMKCPNCGIERVAGASDCASCGIFFEKWAKRQAENDLEAPARKESPRETAGPTVRFNLSSCFVAAAVYAAGEVACVFLTVKMGIPVIGIIVVSLAFYPTVIAYFARSVWRLTPTELMWSILIVSGPTLLYGMLVNPKMIRFVLDFAALAVSAGCGLAGFTLAKRNEINPG
jgi:hypothetical protein